MQTINYNTRSFIESLYEKAEKYFKALPNGRYASPLFFTKSLFFLFLYAAAYYCLLFLSFNLLMLLLVAVVLGICHVLIPVNIAHDAIHQTLSRHRWLNRLGSYGLEITGANSYMYGNKHLEAHREKENGNKTSSIESQGLLLQTKSKAATVNLPYFYYVFYAQYLVFIRDFVLFNQMRDKVPAKEWTKLYISKIVYCTAFLILPFVFSPAPWWQILLALVLMYLIVTVLLVVILLMPTEKMHNSKMNAQNSYNQKWVVEILEHNVDFSPGNRLMNALVGGTNLNVVHYLFPDVNHIHYNQLAALIEETANEYGLLYRKQALVDVFGIHLKYLKNIEKNTPELTAPVK